VSGKPLDCVGVDPAKAQVGKHDFQPSPTEPIVHGVGQVPLAGDDLAAVTRERDALVRVIHLAGAMAGHPKDANEGCRNICKLVRETKDKLASGELRRAPA